MRQLLFVIVLAAAAYYGWHYYQSHKETIAVPWQETSGGEVEDQAPTAGARGQTGPVSAPPRQFVSKIRIPDATPGQKGIAPPGHVYITSRASVETAHGIVAVVPGDLVKLLQRRQNGTVRVTNDQADFELKEDQVTLDPEIARAAEKRDFEMRMSRR